MCGRWLVSLLSTRLTRARWATQERRAMATGAAGHGDGSGRPSSEGTPCDRGGSERQAQSTVTGSRAQPEGESPPPSANLVHDASPLQSLSSGPWRPADRCVHHIPLGDKATNPSPSSHLHPFPSVSFEDGNPSDSSRIAAAGRVER
jgi:hypothetical protein